MNKKQAGLLQDLYNMLWNLPRDHKFDITSWIGDEGASRHTLDRFNESGVTEEVAVECGTSCCAVGWAAILLPSWRKLGWRFDARPAVGAILRRYEGDDYKLGVEDWLAEDLGIGLDDVMDLFYGDHYEVVDSFLEVTPTMVRKHIVEVMDRYGWELCDDRG